VTTAVLESPLSLFAQASRPREGGAPRPTLEERLEATWRAARRDGHAGCPVCEAVMRHESGTARCSGCGSTLS
jgi:hypothetical protein